MNARLMLRPGPKKGAAAGREKPLVAVAGVPIGADGGNVELNLARCVRAVDEHERAALARGGDDCLDGPDEARRRRNMVDDDESSTVGDGMRQYRWIGNGNGDVRFNRRRT